MLAGAVGGLWWLRNLIVYNAVQPPGLTTAQANQVWPPLPRGPQARARRDLRPPRARPHDHRRVGRARPHRAPEPARRDHLHREHSGRSADTAGFCLMHSRTPRGWRRAGPLPKVTAVELAMLLLPTVLVVVPLLYHGWSDYSRTGQLIGIQGRYLYPGFVGLVAIAAVGGDFIATARSEVGRAIAAAARVRAGHRDRGDRLLRGAHEVVDAQRDVAQGQRITRAARHRCDLAVAGPHDRGDLRPYGSERIGCGGRSADRAAVA